MTTNQQTQLKIIGVWDEVGVYAYGCVESLLQLYIDATPLFSCSWTRTMGVLPRNTFSGVVSGWFGGYFSTRCTRKLL